MIGKLLSRLYRDLHGTFTIFMDESRSVFGDTGVIIFFFVVPLLYPLLYSWLYNNETVKDVPVAIVDQSRSPESRDFITRVDATEGIRVRYHANSVEEGKQAVMSQECRGVIVIPQDFASKLVRKEQNIIHAYVDMSGILYYKGVLISLTDVSMTYGLSEAPLRYEAVPLFNPSAGYGSFLLPSVLILIIQQTLLLGIGLAAGTARENNRFGLLIPELHHKYDMIHIVLGKALCYFLIYLILGAYITVAVPHLFHFIQLADMYSILYLLIPYILACIFLGMTLSVLIRYRENVIMLVIFTSVPLLFLSGISWPDTAISGSYKAIAHLFPSTFGINGFIKMNSMGAGTEDINNEIIWLWALAGVYFVTACFVYWIQITRFRNWRLSDMTPATDNKRE